MKNNTTINLITTILNYSALANILVAAILLVSGIAFASTLVAIMGILALCFSLVNFIAKHAVYSYLEKCN
jgi:ABC-type Na+ efflux pump permease subunit